MPNTLKPYDTTIICYACLGQGHVEGNDCLCSGWGRLRVRVLGPCDRRGVVKSTSLDDDPDVAAKILRLASSGI